MFVGKHNKKRKNVTENYFTQTQNFVIFLLEFSFMNLKFTQNNLYIIL